MTERYLTNISTRNTQICIFFNLNISAQEKENKPVTGVTGKLEIFNSDKGIVEEVVLDTKLLKHTLDVVQGLLP